MTVCLISCFRNSARKGHLARYFQQVAALARALYDRGDRLRIIASEGDSDDHTRASIRALCNLPEGRTLDLMLVDGSHGGPEMGSTTDPTRLAQFAHAANAGFDQVRVTDDIVINVESDLIWTPEVLLGLIDRLSTSLLVPVDIVTAPVFAGKAFYDTWAFRKDGVPFAPLPPYHAGLNPVGLTELDSCGSLLVMWGEVARRCRMASDDAVVGFCRQARALGARIWVDWTLRIEHPV